MSSRASLKWTGRACLFDVSPHIFTCDKHLGIKPFCSGRHDVFYSLRARRAARDESLRVSTAFPNICREPFPAARMTKVSLGDEIF